MFATGGVMAACAGSACMTATCSCCGAVGGAIAKISARALYVALFVLTTALAVVMRDYAKPMLAKLPWVVHAAGGAAGFEPEDEWFGAQAVYRVSLGAFVFFAAMSLLLADVRDRADPRDAMIQHGNWTLKVVAWVTCLVFCLFFVGAHSGVITAYVWFARVASGLFLCAQSVILLDFAFLWNASWLRRSEHATERGDEKAATGWIMGLVLGTLVLFGGAVALFAFLYRWYVQGDAAKCATNAWLISVVVVFVVVCAAASAHPAAAERGASVLPAAVVAAYCAYLTHAALASEPEMVNGAENECAPKRASAGGAGRREPAGARRRGADAPVGGVLGAAVRVGGLFRGRRGRGRSRDGFIARCRRGRGRGRRGRGRGRRRRRRRRVPRGAGALLVLVFPRRLRVGVGVPGDAAHRLGRARGRGRRGRRGHTGRGLGLGQRLGQDCERLDHLAAVRLDSRRAVRHGGPRLSVTRAKERDGRGPSSSETRGAPKKDSPRRRETTRVLPTYRSSYRVT